MNSAKVIPFNGITRLDLPADQILQRAAGKVDDVLIIGIDPDGEFYFATNMAGGGEVLWFIEQCKSALLTACD